MIGAAVGNPGRDIPQRLLPRAGGRLMRIASLALAAPMVALAAPLSPPRRTARSG